MDLLQFYRLKADALPPKRQLPNSIGYDIHAYLKTESGRTSHKSIAPQSTCSISTGLVLLAPPGHCLLVCSRSGLAKSSVFVANAPGVVDPDYVGELQILLCNTGWEPYHVRHEDRIAQLLILPRPATPEIAETEQLPNSDRGSRGFGSTGR